MAEVERLCDNLLILKSGEIIERGAPKELINHSGKDTLEEVFLDIVRSPTTSNKPNR